jgi:hypothetical protein
VRAIALSFALVHPIEMLRAVARSRMAPPGELAAEAAWGLGALASEEPAAVLPACRRLLERQPACGPLWWVCARILTAGDPVREADSCASLLLEDRTPRVLRSALKGQKGEEPRRAVRQGGIGEVAAADVVVVEVSAIGAQAMVVPASRRGLLESARASETPVWVESGVGRLLPPRLWSALDQHLRDPRDAASSQARGTRTSGIGPHSDLIEGLEGVELVFTPTGVGRVADLEEMITESGCPEPSELTSGW